MPNFKFVDKLSNIIFSRLMDFTGLIVKAQLFLHILNLKYLLSMDFLQIN
jgi:hypothetical protein